MKKIDRAALAWEDGSNYPSPFDAPCRGQMFSRIGRAAGLTAFGVNISRLPPGVWSSQRHWHTHEDEAVCVLEGELTLVTDAGEELLRAGDVALFRAGDRDGHHLINKSDREAVVLEIGNNDPERDVCDYPDIDMIVGPGAAPYRHRDGTPYPAKG
jgi:uncharacterized cupin superfamily protein